MLGAYFIMVYLNRRVEERHCQDLRTGVFSAVFQVLSPRRPCDSPWGVLEKENTGVWTCFIVHPCYWGYENTEISCFLRQEQSLSALSTLFCLMIFYCSLLRDTIFKAGSRRNLEPYTLQLVFYRGGNQNYRALVLSRIKKGNHIFDFHMSHTSPQWRKPSDFSLTYPKSVELEVLFYVGFSGGLVLSQD
jgi:hypothetical protein